MIILLTSVPYVKAADVPTNIRGACNSNPAYKDSTVVMIAMTPAPPSGEAYTVEVTGVDPHGNYYYVGQYMCSRQFYHIDDGRTQFTMSFEEVGIYQLHFVHQEETIGDHTYLDSQSSISIEVVDLLPPPYPPEYYLEIEVEGSGYTNPDDYVHTYDDGTGVIVTETPAIGWEFSHWLINGNIEDPNSFDNIISLIMYSDQSLTAVFTQVIEEYDLTIEVEGSGSTNPSEGTHTYTEDTDVDVTATASSGWSFSHWLLDGSNVGSTNLYEVTMDDDHTLTAVFTEVPLEEFDLTIAKIGSGSTNPSAGTHTYTEGTSVDVTATPSTDWTFSHWLLDSANVGDTNPYTVTMDDDHTLTAVFTEDTQEPPVASFTYSPVNPQVNGTITFDASGCSDADGTIVSYLWDFGDGNTSTSQNPTHAYDQEGSYTVTLTVADDDGLTDTATATIAEVVIPEFPSWVILPLLLIATILVTVCRKRLKRKVS